LQHRLLQQGIADAPGTAGVLGLEADNSHRIPMEAKSGRPQIRGLIVLSSRKYLKLTFQNFHRKTNIFKK
jgi:hypothetical protein